MVLFHYSVDFSNSKIFNALKQYPLKQFLKKDSQGDNISLRLPWVFHGWHGTPTAFLTLCHRGNPTSVGPEGRSPPKGYLPEEDERGAGCVSGVSVWAGEQEPACPLSQPPPPQENVSKLGKGVERQASCEPERCWGVGEQAQAPRQLFWRVL